MLIFSSEQTYLAVIYCTNKLLAILREFGHKAYRNFMMDIKCLIWRLLWLLTYEYTPYFPI